MLEIADVYYNMKTYISSCMCALLVNYTTIITRYEWWQNCDNKFCDRATNGIDDINADYIGADPAKALIMHAYIDVSTTTPQTSQSTVDITTIIRTYYETQLHIYKNKTMSSLAIWIDKFANTIVDHHNTSIDSTYIINITYYYGGRLMHAKFDIDNHIDLINGVDRDDVALDETHDLDRI